MTYRGVNTEGLSASEAIQTDEEIVRRYKQRRGANNVNPNGRSRLRIKVQPEAKASDIMSELLREEFDNWMEQYLPVEREIMDLATDKQDNLQAENFARESTGLAFDQSRRANDLQRQGLGLSLSADEAKFFDSRSQRNKQAAMVSNVNNARLHAADRDKQILSGSMSSGLSSIQDNLKVAQ